MSSSISNRLARYLYLFQPVCPSLLIDGIFFCFWFVYLQVFLVKLCWDYLLDFFLFCALHSLLPSQYHLHTVDLLVIHFPVVSCRCDLLNALARGLHYSLVFCCSCVLLGFLICMFWEHLLGIMRTKLGSGNLFVVHQNLLLYFHQILFCYSHIQFYIF